MFKIKLLQLITGLILLSLFLVACDTPQAEDTNVVFEATALSSDNSNSESQAEIVLVSDEVAVADNGEEVDVSQTAVSPTTNEIEEETIRPDGWSDETHSKSADPNYNVVFPQDEVNTMTITIDPADWQAMLDDMTANYGEFGTSSRGSQGGGGQGGLGNRPAAPGGEGPVAPLGEVPGEPPDAPLGDALGAPAGNRPGVPGQGGAFGEASSENPIWVAANIEFEGDIWTDVGVRFKGNSSLMSTWSSGSLEMPFKLDFDEFEDENPAIDNQRFYGFKQLSLSNNYNDNTFMRDAVVSDIYEEVGIASAETAFYELIIDYGEGPVSFGLYTMIEVIDDTVVERVFGDDDGNIYEADGTAVSLAEGTFDTISTSFQKENNEDDADWSDIESLYTILHSDTRQSDPDTWKTELEAIFDVDTFLQWLAINTVIENWDTYGAMTHNFYLYNNPETGLLTWIPWDHNEALSEGKRSTMTLSMDSIGAEWPLISYLLADSDYYNTYVNYIDETINTVFVADEMADTYQEIASLIEPYATEKVGADAFAQGVQALIDHTYTRVSEAESFLAQSGQ